MTQRFFDADTIAERVWRDYDAYCVGNPLPERQGASDLGADAMPIKSLATDYLGLTVYRAPLGGDVLGMTTYCESTLHMMRDDEEFAVCLPKGTILLDESLYGVHGHNRRRFTLAHEVAHQLIYRLDGTQADMHFRKAQPPRTPGDVNRITSWCEADANRLASALLMPSAKVQKVFRELFSSPLLEVFGDATILPQDQRRFRALHRRFSVSGEAMLHRLQGLDLRDERPYEEYATLYPTAPDPYEQFTLPYPPYSLPRWEIEASREYFISRDGIVMPYGIEPPRDFHY